MNLNPNYPDPPMDPDNPDSQAMPDRRAYPRASEHTIPVGGAIPGVDPGPDQDVDFTPEGAVVGPRDPYSEIGERLPSPPEERDVAQEPEEFSDAWITLKVKAALAVHRDVSALSTEVVTDHGVVTLSGTADTPHERQEAAMVAQDIKGVSRVDNRLLVNNRPRA